jgi:RNA-binding protein YlmH
LKDISDKDRSQKGDKEKMVYLLNKILQTKKSSCSAFTDFLNPDEQMLVSRLCIENGMKVVFYGGKGEFERAIGVISDDTYEEDIPVDVIKITGNFKFEKLNHRDYLGTILSLGIKREKVGDINLYEDGAEIWVIRDISSFICQNLSKIKHTGIKASIISMEDSRERIQDFKPIKINIASFRLDSIIAALTGFSRNQAAEYIKSGNIKLNFSEIKEADEKIETGDLISIKGFGRYKITGDGSTTRSGRINIEVKKYI